MISGHVWILPAATVAGWILSWWGPRRLRWGLLVAAVVVSALCLAVSALTKGAPIAPDSSCRPAFQCISGGPIYWAEAGVLGLVCSIPLAIATLVVDLIDRD